MSRISNERVLGHKTYGTTMKPSYYSNLITDSHLYATQAQIKAGIGEFVTRGLSKREQNENPNSFYYSPTCTREGLQQILTHTLQTKGLRGIDAGDTSRHAYCCTSVSSFSLGFGLLRSFWC